MLCLGRKKGQRIFIGSNIVIEVLETTNNRTRLGIYAPPDVVILREEIANTTPDSHGERGARG